MASWTIDEPGKRELDPVDRVLVQLIEGAVSVVGSDGPPTLEVSQLEGEPLRVRQEDGALTVDYERPGRSGLLAWLTSMGKRKAVVTLAVPRDCRVELQVVSASLMAGGLRAPVLAKTVSGEITLAGLGGAAEAETVSGAVQASAIRGDLSASTVSGEITVAEGGGSVRARTISGTIAMDLGPSGDRDIELSSVSGRPHRPRARGQRPRGQAPVDLRPGGQRLRAAGARPDSGPARGQGPARQRHRPAQGVQHLRPRRPPAPRPRRRSLMSPYSATGGCGCTCSSCWRRARATAMT